MKIYKVNLDPSNPVEKLVKVPVGSTYGLQINWNYEKFPTFTNSDVDTENGKLTNVDGVITENTSFAEINGQKIFTDLPVIENVGNTIIFVYGKNETFDDNKLDNFGAIKVVGVDTDDYDVDIGGGGSSFEYITETDNTVNINANTYIKSPDNGSYTYYVNGGICTNSNGCIWICADSTYIKGNNDVRIFSYGAGMGMTIQSSGDIKLNSGADYNVYVNGSPVGAPTGVVDGLYNVPAEVNEDSYESYVNLDSLKTVYKYIPTSNNEIYISTSYILDMPTNAIITFWLWIVMGDTAHELTFPTSVTFIDNAPALAANTETMLALTSTDGGTTWLANTQWVK